jgi:hypothetical protein
VSSITNGWDAVCALDETQVNALLQQQFVDASGDFGAPLTFGFVSTDAPSGSCAVVQLAAPHISLSALSGGQAAASAAVNSALVISTGYGAMWFSPQCLSVQPNVQLQQVAGKITNSLGSVVLAFPGQLTPETQASIYDGLTNYLANGPVAFTLGEIINTSAGPGLEPTSFELAIQSDGNGNSALLLLITTTGSPGASPSLSTYPLSPGVAAALLISENLLWNTILPGAFEIAFNQTAYLAGFYPYKKIVFASQQAADGTWSLSVTSGIATLGILTMGPDDPGGAYIAIYSCGKDQPGYYDMKYVPLPLTGSSIFTVSMSGTVLQQSYATSFQQGWCEPKTNPAACTQVPMTFSYQFSGAPTLDATTSVVTFTGDATTSLEPDSSAPGWFKQIWSEGFLKQWTTDHPPPPTPDPGPAFNWQTFFPYATAPSINTFALVNLLFPNSTQLTLNALTLPGDLELTGALEQSFGVQPQTVSLMPGSTQQFTASAADVAWKCSAGTIDRTTGLFTAPASNAAQTITITAFDIANDASANAVVTIVVPSSGLVVSPSQVWTAGNFPIFATDLSGAFAEVTCTCSNSAVQLARLDVGQWMITYAGTPPAGTTFTINVTSVADPSLTATVNAAIAQLDTITVNLDSSTGIATASSAAGYTEFYWAFIPASAGSVVPSPGNPTQASVTITAQNDAIAVAAFYADPVNPTYGMGLYSLST